MKNFIKLNKKFKWPYSVEIDGDTILIIKNEEVAKMIELRKVRNHKEIAEYLDEAFDKVWLMRNPPRAESLPAYERIFQKYDDIPDGGYDDWECGYWNGVLATLRWVLKDEEKDNLDT